MSKPTFDLGASAYAEMIKDGFHPDFLAGTDAQIIAIAEKIRPGVTIDPGTHDLRDLYWSSIDNDTSRDLDQIEWAERVAGSDPKTGPIRVRVAVANVAAAVAKGTPIDQHAAAQTKTIYT